MRLMVGGSQLPKNMDIQKSILAIYMIQIGQNIANGHQHSTIELVQAKVLPRHHLSGKGLVAPLKISLACLCMWSIYMRVLCCEQAQRAGPGTHITWTHAAC